MNRRAARIGVLLAALSFACHAATAQPKNPSFNLVNNAGAAIRALYATPAGMENWGQNRLGSQGIAPGARFPVRLRADGNCLYDLRVVFADGRSEERRRVDTCNVEDVAVGAAAATQAQHAAALRLLNRGSSPVTEVYAVPAGSSGGGFGANLLADGATLAPQASRSFTLPAGQCSFDLRVVFANKQSREKKGADLCRTADLPVQ